MKPKAIWCVMMIAASVTSGFAQEEVAVDILSRKASNRGSGHANKIVTLGQGGDRRTHVVWHDYTPDPAGPAVGPGWQSRRNATAMIRTFSHGTGSWSDPVVIGQGVDNHCNPALASDSEGVLHVVYGAHASPLFYRHSQVANDSSAWSEVIAFGSGCTYPSLVIDADDALHVTCRDRVPPQPGSRWTLGYYRKRQGRDWERVASLVDSQRTAYTNFYNRLAIGPDGHLSVSYYVYRPDLSGGNFVGYMRSRDGGESWESVAGRGLDLPRVPGQLDDAEIVVGGDGTRVLTPTLTVDSAGRPCVLAVHREKPRWYPVLYRWEGETWSARPLTDVLDQAFPSHSGFGRLSRSEDGAVWILLGAGRAGGKTDGFILLRIDAGSADPQVVGVRRWSTADDLPNWRPRIERPVGHNAVRHPAIVYLHGPNGGNQENESYNEIHVVPPDWIGEALQRSRDKTR